MTENRRRSQEKRLTTVLDVLLYDDGWRKDLTRKSNDFIDTATAALSRSYTLLVDGIVHFTTATFARRLLVEAEAEGCDHPILYYYLGKCFCDSVQGNNDVVNPASKAIEYYMKAVAGTFMNDHYTVSFARSSLVLIRSLSYLLTCVYVYLSAYTCMLCVCLLTVILCI